MIEAVIDGGWKSILTAILLITMSILSVMSLVTEGLRIRREMRQIPTSLETAEGGWEILRQEVERAREIGYKGKALDRHVKAVAKRVAGEGQGYGAILASIGANAPYIGLFGTVVGIYGALQAMGVGLSNSADKIAGSVGEALVMTALGLMVAIPAIFGFNYITVQRTRLANKLEAYGIWLTTGISDGAHMKILKGTARKRKFG